MCTKLSNTSTIPQNLTLFSSCTIYFGRSVSFSTKSSFRKIINKSGGSVAGFLTNKVTHFVTDEWEETQARKCHGFIVNSSWIADSIEANCLKDEAPYLVCPKLKRYTFGKKQEEVDVNKKIESLIKSAVLNINAVTVGAPLVAAKKSTTALNKKSIITSGFKPSEPTPNKALEFIQMKKLERERQREETLRKAKEKLEQKKKEFARQQQAIKQQREEEKRRKQEIKEQEAKERANRIAALTASISSSSPTTSRISSNSSSSTSGKSQTISSSAPSSNSNSQTHKNSYLTPTEKQDVLEIYSIKSYLDEYKREEARQASILAREKHKQDMELKKLKKKLKKEQIRAAREENARIGKAIADTKRQEKEAAKQQKRLEYEQRQLEWKLTQQEREIAWKSKLDAVKSAKKAKKREFIAKQQDFAKQEANERGRKLFIGKITFDDLLKHATDSELYVKERKEQLLTMLRSFGHIERIIEHWEKGFIFVVYVARYDAEQAFATLSKFDNRKQLCKDAKAVLQLSGSPSLVVPKPNFYIRWPKGHNL